MAVRSWDQIKTDRKEVAEMLQSSDNKKWFFKRWLTKAWAYIGIFIAMWQMPGLVGFSISNQIMLPVFLLVVLLILLATIEISMRETKDYLHKKVITERPGCTVEIRVADGYLTNAFHNYPKAAMMIGINKAFWFQEAEPGSLVADLWAELKRRGIAKEQVQCQIDEALKKVKETEKDGGIDLERPTVLVKKFPSEEEKASGQTADFVERDNFKIGTIVGVDLRWEDPEKTILVPLIKLLPNAFASSRKRFKYNVSALTNRILLGKNHGLVSAKPERFGEYIKSHRIKKTAAKSNLRKLYFIANSEVVQGKDTSEPMKVISDKKAPVAESFEKIWEYFEQEEKLTKNPPEHVLYSPLLLPLIGAGVANEGYTDLEIFSQLIDLYYKHLRKSIREGTSPAIPQLIINIRNKTAIEIDKNQKSEERKIDIETAFWYLDYKNQVNQIRDAKA